MELLIDRELVVTKERLERIYQAIMFYADSVNIRLTSQIPNNDKSTVRRLSELRDIGALRTWAHEYEVDDGGRTRNLAWKTVFDGPADKVLPLPQMKDMVQQVDGDLDVAVADQAMSPGLREGIAELVQFRQSVIGVRLADVLATDGLLTGRDYPSLLPPDLVYRPRPPTGPAIEPVDQLGSVVETIVDLCTFQRQVSDLPIKAITDCRHHMPAFRQYLQRKVIKSRGKTADELAREVVYEYQNILERYAKGHELSSFASDVGWDVVGAILPPAVLMKYVTKPIEWSARRRDFRPFLLLSKLRAHERP